MKRITILCGLLVLMFLQYRPLFAQTSYPDPAVIQDLFQRVNALRDRHGLRPLSFDPALMTAAQDQAEWLVATGIRAHFRPDGSRPSTRARDAGFVTNAWCCGENYYMSIDATPDMVWDFWLRSPHHYANLVNSRFDSIGIGMATNGTRYSYVLVFGTALDSAAPQPTADSAVSPESGGDYIVQPGDTLFRIAQRFGIRASLLAETNHITNPALIYPGQRLIVPGASEASPVPATATAPAPAAVEDSGQQTHTVQAGEDLFRIAQNYGTTVQAIMDANGIDNRNLIYVGQQLVIPAH